MNYILLDNIIEILQQTTDYLYQEDLRPAYMIFAAVLPKFEELVFGMESNQQELVQEKLGQTLEVMEQQDATLLADTIQYELLECLYELKG